MTSASWHRGIGKAISSDMSLDEQLSLAGLDWEVGISPICYGSSFEHTTEETKYRKAIFRKDTGLLLDTVGKSWEPFQNKKILGTFHDFCEKAGLEINSLGSLEEGRTIFASAELPQELNIRQVGDIVKARILLFNYHKAGYGLNIRLQLERLVCSNGMTEPVKVGNKIISHVGGFSAVKVQRILEGCQQSFFNFGNDAEKLATKLVSIPEAHLILIKEFGDPAKPIHDQPAMIQTCFKLFDGQGKGSELLSAYGSMWGLYNAITEFYNHHSQVRGGTSTHLNSLLLGSKAQKQLSFKQRLLSLC